MSQTRRLAAILAADVAGYSRLMGEDEEGTLERLKALRRELLDPKIAEHRGRIVAFFCEGSPPQTPSQPAWCNYPRCSAGTAGRRRCTVSRHRM
jgi:hypothetical protein